MQIKEGKYYKARNGQKIGPMRKVIGRPSWSPGWECADKNGPTKGVWDSEGWYNYLQDEDHSPLDLIEEWKEETALPCETVDQIAIYSLLWHSQQNMAPLQREAFRIVLRYYGKEI